MSSSFYVTPDPALGVIEFIGEEGKAKLMEKITITNNTQRKLGFKVKTTDNSILVKPGSGEVFPGQVADINLVIVIDQKKSSDPFKGRLKLEVLQIDDPWDISQLSDLLKNRSVGDGKFDYAYKLRIRTAGSAVVPEQSSIFHSSTQPVHERDQGLAAFQSTIDDPRYASAIPGENISFRQKDNVFRSEFQTSVGNSQVIDRESAGGPSRQLGEAIDQRDKTISKLEQEKKKLEDELSDVRSKLLVNRDRPTAHAKSSPMETWKLLGFAVVALFLGYFVGTK